MTRLSYHRWILPIVVLAASAAAVLSCGVAGPTDGEAQPTDSGSVVPPTTPSPTAEVPTTPGSTGSSSTEPGSTAPSSTEPSSAESGDLTPATSSSTGWSGEPPDVVRALRVSRYVASMPELFDGLLTLADETSVNALIFDTKDETGQVLYATEVAEAAHLGAVKADYDPSELLALAAEHNLYPLTRIVTFEDPVWSQDAAASLGGTWVNGADRDNWAYPLDLAEEACRLGFAEIQFDYIRFPAGRTAAQVADRLPATSQARSDVIAEFLTTAAERLEPLGCGVSAAVFGITMSSPTDEGIGQQLEIVAPPLDAISPMIYPSHYNSGWLGLDDPNDQPGPVVADALDDADARLASLDDQPRMRPWLQAFSYNGEQVRAQIAEAEARGAGWLLWNASGRYQADWLPPAEGSDQG